MKRGLWVAVLGLVTVALLVLLPTQLRGTPQMRSGPAPGAASGLSAAQTPPATIQVLGLGDSVMAGTACDCEGIPAAFAARLQSNFGRQVSWVNAAQSGATSQDLLQDLAEPAVKSEVATADVILITVGANDVVRAVEDCPPQDCGDQVAAVTQGVGRRLSKILAQIRQAQAGRKTTTLVLGYWNVFAVDDPDTPLDPDDNPIDLAATQETNAVLAKVSRSNGARYVDLNRAFFGHSGDDDPLPLLAEDGDHPNAGGVDAIVAELMRAVSIR